MAYCCGSGLKFQADPLDFFELKCKIINRMEKDVARRRNAMEKLDLYREKLEAQLKEWKAMIEVLEEKAAKATGETKTELQRAIGELSQKIDVVKEKFNSLQKEGGAAWDTLKDGVEKAAGELKNALDKIVSRFK